MTGYLKKLVRKGFALLNRFFRYLLSLYFRFDKWHIVTLYEKKYAADSVKHLNAKPKAERDTLVEIGCGLGDIVRNVNYIHKTGYDREENALKAARLLSAIAFTSKADFRLFSFPETPLHEKCDAILLINWIHHIEPPVLKTTLENYFRNNLKANGEIIIDTVQDKEYRFNHDIHYLSKDMGATVNKLGDYERQRELWIIKKSQ